jgi:MSHA biogenesis protein MshO
MRRLAAGNLKQTLVAKYCYAFTLIELVVVIVILAILAAMGTGFAVRSIESYRVTQNRAILVNSARPVLERMTRQLRGALPYSVRIVNSGNCIQFMPIAAAGNYLSAVPDSYNGAPPTSAINVSPYNIIFFAAKYVSIGAMSASEIYGAAPVSIATYNAASSATQVQLTAPKSWQRNSINRRFYLLDNPQAFCVLGSNLFFYKNLNVAQASVDTSAPSNLMARNITAITPFTLAQGSENRNTKITLSITFGQQGETILFNQGVMIRNVP